MNETSVLGRYLWVFRRIVGQMQHDLFHVYTVDQHILMVLRNVRRFFIPEHVARVPVLLAARLDVQTGPGCSTSRRCSTMSPRAVAATIPCSASARCGASAASTVSRARTRALIEYLVGQHLTMSRIAQKEDLSDPDVIGEFARSIGSERRLTALYLLTVADIRGTSPKVWNAWKSKLLEDL